MRHRVRQHVWVRRSILSLAKIESSIAINVVGEHAITLYGAHEELTLQHRVADRMVFARGMVRAALFLAEQPRTPKLYGIDDLLDTTARESFAF